MPKLPENVAQETESAEVGNAIEEGIYEMVLTAVTDTKNGEPLVGKDSGQPYWTWELTFPEDANGGRYKRRKVWRNISLGPDAASMRKEAFMAFGEPVTADTDAMVERGARCLVHIKNRLYQGEAQPDIRKLMPLDGVAPASAGAGKGSGKTSTKAADKALF